MAKKLSKKFIVVTLSLLALGLVGGAVYIKNSQKTPSQLDETTGNLKGDSITSEPQDGDSAEDPDKVVSSSTQANADFKAPTLQKSSGNNGAIPSDILVEFTCEGQPGLECQIVLTNKSDSANVIALEAKKIADNGRGQYFARWEWKSKQGTWIVKAVATNGSVSKTSTTQELTVN